MAKNVAYVPISTVPQSQVNAPTKIEEPQYPDKGVEYAGYSKTSQSGNQFLLNPQTPFNYTLVRPAIVAGVESHTIGYPDEGKSLYITSIQLNTSISAVDVNSYIEFKEYPTTGTSRTLWKTGLLRSETFSCVFDVPIKCSASYQSGSTPSGFVILISSGAATLNVTSINIQGWIE